MIVNNKIYKGRMSMKNSFKRTKKFLHKLKFPPGIIKYQQLSLSQSER